MTGTAAPTTKVAAGGAVGLITALIMWAITASGVDVPEPVLAGVPWLAGWIAAYMTPDKLVELGRELHAAQSGRHADNGDGVKNNATPPASPPASPTRLEPPFDDAVGAASDQAKSGASSMEG